MAADAPLAAWNWTGCHAGVHVGGLWGDESWTNRAQGGAYSGQGLGSHDVGGVIGGPQGGCDYQFAGHIVLGIEGSYAWSDASGSHPSLHETGVTYGSGAQSLGTLTARAGYAWDTILGYIKVGAAWEDDEVWASTTRIGLAYRGEPTRTGWTVGAGAEYAFSPQFSAFVEYDYYDFGTDRIGLTAQIAGLRPAAVDLSQNRSAMSVGVNYRF